MERDRPRSMHRPFTSPPSRISVVGVKHLCQDEAAIVNTHDDGSSTHVGSSSAPNFDSSIVVDPEEVEQVVPKPCSPISEYRGGIPRHLGTTKYSQRQCSRSSTIEDAKRLPPNCSLHTARLSSSKEVYDIKILNPFLPPVSPLAQVSVAAAASHTNGASNLTILTSSSSPRTQLDAMPAHSSPNTRRRKPIRLSPTRSKDEGDDFTPSSPPSRHSHHSPQRRNLLKPPSPGFNLRPRRFQHRHSVTSTPLSACTDRGTDSGKMTSATPEAVLQDDPQERPPTNSDDFLVVKLDEIGISQCPRCSSRSLYIPAPQVAAAIGAVVYRAKLEHKVYFGELVSCQKRTETPTTEVVAPESLEFITDPLERTHRERKRWQQLLKTMFDHLATRGHPENNPPHVALKMWRSAQLDRESFLQVFPQLPGVVGERLFAAFDVNKNGVIDFEEFTNGLAILSSSNLNNKLRFIFNMYDLNGDGELSRDEMSMMLYHIPSSFSFLSNGRSRNLEKEPGNGSYRRRSSSSISTSALVKMLRTSRGRHELTIAGQKQTTAGSHELAPSDTIEELYDDHHSRSRPHDNPKSATVSPRLPSSARHQQPSASPRTYSQGTSCAPAKVTTSQKTSASPRTSQAPVLALNLDPQSPLPSSSKQPPRSPRLQSSCPPSKAMPPLDLARVNVASLPPRRSNSKLMAQQGCAPKYNQTLNPSDARSNQNAISHPIDTTPRSNPSSRQDVNFEGPSRAATMSARESRGQQKEGAQGFQGIERLPRRATVTISPDAEDGPSPRAPRTQQVTPRAPSSPTGSARRKPVDPQLKAALTRLKLGVLAVSAPAVSTPTVSPRSRTHREVLMNPSPRQHASPRRFSLGSSSPSKDGPLPKTSIDLANMSRLLHSEKATEKTVKEFEILVDKLVDRAFQIYDREDSPRRVDHMSFEKFCEAVMKFQELRLALEVFCQETIQPQSFMPVPPDVLSTSQATSRTNVLRSIGGARKLAAKITQGNEPNTTTNAAANASQPYQMPVQNAVRSCVSDIEDPRACTRREDCLANRKFETALTDDEEGLQNGFAVDCSNCGAQYMCRLRTDEDNDAAGNKDAVGNKGEKQLMLKRPSTIGREVWDAMTYRFTGPKGTPSSTGQVPPCIRAHGDNIDFCGWLEKDGRRTGLPVRRFYLLRDRFLYYYRTVNDLTPLHATLITGCHCDKTINDPRVTVVQEPEYIDGRRGSWPKIDLEIPKRFAYRYGFEIRPHYRGGRRSTLYARTPNERDLWIKYINKASGVTGAGFHDVYMLQEPLGKGKFATVYRAMNRATMERVAVKILKKPSVGSLDSRQAGALKKSWFSRHRRWGKKDAGSEEEENEASIREFQRTEVAVLRLLYHPNLIRLLDVFNTNQYLYLVMEWGPSGDLRRTIDIVRQLNAGLAKRREALAAAGKGIALTPGLTELWIPEWIVREIIIGVLQGLSYLHSSKRNVIHRDLKPDNVLIKILISQLKFTMKQCITGLPSISSNTFELVPSHSARSKPRSKTTPVSNLGQFQSRFLFDRDLDEDEVAPPGHHQSAGLQQHDSSPASVIRDEDTPSNESLDTVDFYPNVDSNGIDLEAGTDSSLRLTPMSIEAVRDQLRVAGLKNTDTLPNDPSSGCGPQPDECHQDQVMAPSPNYLCKNEAVSSHNLQRHHHHHHLKFKRTDLAMSATDLFHTPGDESALLSDGPDPAKEERVSQSVTLCKSVLDSQSPKDDTLMLRLGTMNMRRDSEACGRVAAETLNFWIFLHCLEWYDTPRIKERRKRRSLTLPASVAAGIHQSDAAISPPEGGMPVGSAPGEELEGELNENALIPPFLRHKDSYEILQESLNALRSTQTVQSMNALFSSSFVKDAIVPKITDFGLSKIVAPPSNHDVVANATGLATYAEEALGTAAYAAPEVLAGRRYTTSADLWSLGVVTYQLLSGGFFPVFKEVLPSNKLSSLDASGSPVADGGGNVSNTHDAATVSSLLGLSKRLRTNRRNHIKLVLLFQPEHAWGRVGPLGKEFVQKLLDIDPTTRLTARDALAEPWMSREFAFAS